MESIEELIAQLKLIKIQEANIIARIEAAAHKKDEDKSETTRPATNRLTKGDRVRITNRVRKPATWNNETAWDEDKGRLATVTKVTPEQVHIITDNAAARDQEGEGDKRQGQTELRSRVTRTKCTGTCSNATRNRTTGVSTRRPSRPWNPMQRRPSATRKTLPLCSAKT